MDIFPQFQFKLLEYYSVTVLFVKLLDGNGQNQVLLSRMIVNKGKKRNGLLIKEDTDTTECLTLQWKRKMLSTVRQV